jgi:chromosome segregation ATPase
MRPIWLYACLKGGLLMKKRLAVLVVALCLFSAILAQNALAAPKQNFGPGPGIASQTETPKAAPSTEPAAPKPVAPVKVQAPKAETPKAEAPKPAPKAVAATDSTELNKLRKELDAARAEASQAQKGAARATALEKENGDLSARLAAAEKKAESQTTEVKNIQGELDKSRAEVASLKKQVAAKPAVDPGEIKSLQGQLSDARKDAEQAKKKSDGRISELEKGNTDLSAKLAAAQKTAAAAPAEAPDARVMKRLREENSYLRNLLEKYSAKNPELKGQLRHYE